jgi:anthranilate/para-aminobenzoate synthase component II
VVDPDLPDALEVSATGGGVLMGIRHRTLPAEGVQFHPESILTPEGKKILENFLQPSTKCQALT